MFLKAMFCVGIEQYVQYIVYKSEYLLLFLLTDPKSKFWTILYVYIYVRDMQYIGVLDG